MTLTRLHHYNILHSQVNSRRENGQIRHCKLTSAEETKVPQCARCPKLTMIREVHVHGFPDEKHVTI